MTGTKDDDAPASDVLRFEVKLDDSAARHPDVFVEIPLNEARVLRDFSAQHLLRFGDGFCLYAAAADCAERQALLGDDHFRAAVLRNAPGDVNDGDGHERSACGHQLAERFEKRRHGTIVACRDDMKISS